jgi:hypothetical protein
MAARWETWDWDGTGWLAGGGVGRGTGWAVFGIPHEVMRCMHAWFEHGGFDIGSVHSWAWRYRGKERRFTG